ncbi:hypothetical protein H0H93_006856 [Arthromyces matolae]|nr:hypothetical protein H0H93_006856 [Arthromyces matolae]
MASQSILKRAGGGLRSPSFLKPTSTRSILKRPAPLPLSPNPLPFAASFSVVLNSSQLSPHVHFPSSPTMMAATFTAYSANTYDRGPIIVSPKSAGFSPGVWANRPLSPSAHNAFKLLDPPRRKVQNFQLLTVPTFEDPRSPKPFKDVRNNTAQPQLLTVPTFEDPRSPKPYKGPTNTTPHVQKDRSLLSVPAFEDPRSPKPYKPRNGISFQELTLHVPQGVPAAQDLAKSLYTYPRSPYPSAPIEEDAMDVDVDASRNSEGKVITQRGRQVMGVGVGKIRPPPRARSLDKESTRRKHRQTLAVSTSSQGIINSPLRQTFLSPVVEVSAVSSPAVKNTKANKLKAKTPPPSLDLESQFWQSVSLEEEVPASSASASGTSFMTANEFPMSANLMSPGINITFGTNDGEVWSPHVPKLRRVMKRLFDGPGSILSPAQRKAFSKGMVASPSPNDPAASFPSFSVAMRGMEAGIAYPPRAKMEM